MSLKTTKKALNHLNTELCCELTQSCYLMCVCLCLCVCVCVFVNVCVCVVLVVAEFCH